MNRKGYIAPLAMALIVLAIIIFIATLVPSFKATMMDMLKTIFG